MFSTVFISRGGEKNLSCSQWREEQGKRQA